VGRSRLFIRKIDHQLSQQIDQPMAELQAGQGGQGDQAEEHDEAGQDKLVLEESPALSLTNGGFGTRGHGSLGTREPQPGLATFEELPDKADRAGDFGGGDWGSFDPAQEPPPERIADFTLFAKIGDGQFLGQLEQGLVIARV
jgi:hypothetical protein